MSKGGDKVRHAQSFREEEVASMHQLFRALRRGGDVRALLRSDGLRSVERKFLRMAATEAERDGMVFGG